MGMRWYFLRGGMYKTLCGIGDPMARRVLLYQQFYALCFVGGQIGLGRRHGVLLFLRVGNIGNIGPDIKSRFSFYGDKRLIRLYSVLS
jgi:hypothetical protein